MKKTVIFFITTLFFIANINNGFSQLATGWESSFNTCYEQETDIGSKTSVFDSNTFTTGSMLKNDEPGINDPGTGGVVLPTGDGLLIIMYFALAFLFVKRIQAVRKQNSKWE